MKVTIWGTRGSIPAPLLPKEIEGKIYRAILGMPSIDTNNPESVRDYVQQLPALMRGSVGGNTPCVEVRADGEVFVFDAGSGLYQLGLDLMDGPFGRGEGTLHLFISHPHWDHIQGFPMFRPAFVPGNRIFIYGAHDLETAFETQQRSLTWPVSLAYMQAEKQFVHLEPGEPLEIGKACIQSIKNEHPGGAYSFRIEDQHSVFVYASDAEYKKLEDNVVNPYVEFFRKADALVFDAMYTLQDVWRNEDYGHSSAMIGVDLAHAAGVKRLILFHHDPSYSDEQIEQIYATAVAYRSQKTPMATFDVIAACEGMTFELTPPGAVDLHFTSNGDTAILKPTSIFDERGVNELARQLAKLREQYSPANSIIDLSQVETFTTASLKTLVALRQKWQNRPIILTSPPEHIQQIINLSGYQDHFAIYPTVNAAIAAVQAREALNLPGQVVQNRYRIENKVGESPLGSVLQATDMQTDQTVALKILSPAFSRETLERYIHQSQQLVTLDHPNILKVFSLGREGDYVFSIEEFTIAPTLQDFLADHDPTTQNTGYSTIQSSSSASYLMDIAIDIIHALEYAHSRGIVLGDLKPHNIFLTPQGARLTDLGLGRLVEGRNLLDTPRLFLTAHYLAPEQILGQTLDARTDLYAFGIILYQLFTGHLPFEEPTSQEVAETDSSEVLNLDAQERSIMTSHLRQAPHPPRTLNPHISASLEHLILKLLAQNPNDRYASSQQVRRILSNLLLDLEYTTRPRIRLLVGREKQAQALRACWAEAQTGHGQLAFITGEAGSGKTRLAQQVAAQSHPPVLLIGHCQDTMGRPAYELFTEVLRAYLATIPPEFFNTEARQLLSNFSPLIPEISRMLPELHIPPPLEPKQEQLRLMTSLTQFIRRATSERPWFLILEDLQWADRSSLELLLYLGRHLPSMPIFIIGTYRDTEVGRGHPLLETLRGLRSHPTYRHFPLERLTQEEVGQLLTYTWQRPVPDALTEKIYQHTAGNPFYVEEVAKSLEDVGRIPQLTDYESDPTWHLRALEEVQLPQSVRETVWQRIDHLSTETQTLLRQAAILGQTFRFDDLQRMSGMSEWDVLEHLDEALERQMVEEIPGGNGLRFRQTEIQVVIYDDLGPLRRRLLHRKAGEALEQRAGPHIALFAEELAHHFSKAGEIEKAVTYSMLAAHQAQLTYANETALQWYGRVLSMVYSSSIDDPVLQDARLMAHRASGEVLTLVGRYDEALEQYSAAQVLAENSTTSPEERQRQMAGLCFRIANVYELRDEYDAVFAWLTEGLHCVPDDRPIVETAQIYLLGAKVHHRQGENPQALAWCEKSLNIATQIETREGHQVRGAALYTQAGIDMRLGNLDSAVRRCHESIKAYHHTNDLMGESNAYINLASAYVDQGNWDQADEAYQKGWRIKQEIGEVYGQAVIGHHHAELHFKRGDFDKALALNEQCLATWQQIAVPRGEAATLINMAQIYIQQRDWDKVQQLLSRSQTLLNEIGSKEYLPEIERLWGEFYLHTQKLDEALQHTQHAIEFANVYDDPCEGGIAYRVLGQTYLASGDHQLARAALHHSLKILGDLHNEHEIAKTKTVLAYLAISNDDATMHKARSYLKQAIETFEKLRAQADLAQARTLEQQIVSK